MSLFYKYILKTISNTFFPIFLILYAVASVIILVKIASYTSVITISFWELLFLYALNIPQILFYTLPITFFVSVIINLSKLSSEYELIVITSFGMSPLKLLKTLFPISLLVTISLFIVSFVLIPKANYMEEVFMNIKHQEAQFNIKPSEYGQKFGPWYIYVQDKDKKIYKDIILFQTQPEKDTFIIAKQATVKNNNNILSLQLYDGSALTITQHINQIDFRKMSMNNNMKQTRNISSLSDILLYWKDAPKNSSRRRMILQNGFISMLPLISLLFYISFGYFNPRYQSNRNTIYAIVLVVIYMVITQKLATTYRELYTLYVVPIVWILLSIGFYIKRIKRYY